MKKRLSVGNFHLLLLRQYSIIFRRWEEQTVNFIKYFVIFFCLFSESAKNANAFK